MWLSLFLTLELFIPAVPKKRNLSYICHLFWLWLREEKLLMEFEHPSHKHPLILYEDPKDYVQQLNCYGCSLPLSDRPTYKCTQQCNFLLHKSCAQLPNKIIHFLHPKHPLTLFSKCPYYYVVCDNCDERIWGFVFGCSLCNFYLDIKCTLLQQPIVEHEGHQHSFMLCRPTSFTCDACGETDNNGMSYFCSTCQLCVHKNCASLPDTIKQIGHDHPLSLLHTIQIDHPILEELELCKICSLKVDTHYWCYYCASCNYIVHLTCATSMHLNKDVDDKPDPSLSMSVVSEGLRSLSLDVETERVTELKHFSHQHLLTLIDIEPEQSEKCEGCWKVISVPFYNCAQCNFFLHVTCAELPSTILHPLHPHFLTLLEKTDTENRLLSPAKSINCGVCLYSKYGGIHYYCCDCNFFLCVSCTSLSNTLRHDGHEHILNLVQKETTSYCNACGSGCRTKFRCEDCDFNLCLICAVLPRKFRHRWDKHPLKLTFYSVENELGEYDCENCEGVGDRNHWFYHCEDCDVSAHPYCLLGYAPPGTCTAHIYAAHPKNHVLTGVFVKNQRILCGFCNDICRKYAYRCDDCNSYFHLAGFCSSGSG